MVGSFSLGGTAVDGEDDEDTMLGGTTGTIVSEGSSTQTPPLIITQQKYVCVLLLRLRLGQIESKCASRYSSGMLFITREVIIAARLCVRNMASHCLCGRACAYTVYALTMT